MAVLKQIFYNTVTHHSNEIIWRGNVKMIQQEMFENGWNPIGMLQWQRGCVRCYVAVISGHKDVAKDVQTAAGLYQYD